MLGKFEEINLKVLILRLSLRTKVCIVTCIGLSAYLLHKEVGREATHEMSIIRSGRDSEDSKATGGNTPERELGTDRKVQASSSAQSEVEAQDDSPSNSGEHSIYPSSSDKFGV